MTRIDSQRCYTALVTYAVLTAASISAIAQPPAQQVPITSPKPAMEPEFKPSPEEVGDALMARQRYQAAIDAFKQAPTNSASAWNKMGVAYQMMFNFDQAARCYQTALRLEEKNYIVLNNLGTIYVSLKQYSRAEKMYRKALRFNPKSALIHKNLGTALLAEHKYAKGWAAYQDAVAIDPQIFQRNNNAHAENPASVQERGAMNFYMAKGCVRAGQMDRAIEYLRMALNEGFTNPKKIIEDREFAVLRDVPAFQQMLALQGEP